MNTSPKNELITVLKVLGVQEADRQIGTFLELLKRVGKIDWTGFEKHIDSVAKKLRISTREARVFLEELKVGVGRAKAGGFVEDPTYPIKKRSSATQKLTNLGKKTIDWEKDEVERIERYFKSAKPIKIPISFDKASLEAQSKEIYQRIRQIEDPATRLKTARQTLSEITKEHKAQLSVASTLEHKNKLIRDYNNFIKNASTKFGLSEAKVDGIVPQRELNNLNTSIARLQTWNTTKKEATHREKKHQDSISETIDKQERLSSSIHTAIGKLIRYRVAFYAMRTAIEQTKASIQTFAEIQLKLADLEKVIDRATTNISDYKRELLSLSASFGASMMDVVSIMKTWAQTGMEQREVFEATKATLIGVNALGGTTKEVTEALTAAIFTYGIEVQDVTTIVSKWLAVQREFPVSAQDLANSLKVVGAAAQVVGVDLDDLAGYVATITSVTRKSGAAVGQSLKTMFARLPRKKVIQVFESLGISVLKNAHELRDLDDVLGDLSLQWGNLSSVAKANIAVTFGGIRRYADFIALMDNYKLKIAATIEAQKASNEAQEANALTLSTLSKSWDKTTASYKEFLSNIGQGLAGPLGNVIETVGGIIRSFNKFGETTGKIGASIVVFVSTAAALGVAGASVVFVFDRLKSSLSSLSVLFQKTALSAQEYSVSMAQAGMTSGTTGSIIGGVSSALSKVQPWLLAMSLAIGLAGAAWTLFSKKASDASSSVERFEKTSSASIETTRSQIKGLKKQAELLTNLPVEAQKLVSELNKLKLTGGKEYLDTWNKLDNLLKVIPKDITEVNLAISDYRERMDSSATATEKFRKAIDLKILSINSEIISLNELEKQQLQQFLTEQKINKERAQASLEQIRDLESLLSKIQQYQIQAAMPVLPSGASFKESPTQVPLDEFIKKYSTNVNSLSGINKEVNRMLHVQSVGIKDFVNEYNKNIENLADKDLAEKLKKDKNFITLELEDLNKVFNRTAKEFEQQKGIGINVDITGEQRDEFLSILMPKLEKRMESINKYLRKGYEAADISKELYERIREIDQSILKIQTLSTEQPGEFFSGTKMSTEVANIANGFKKIVVSYNNMAREIGVKKETLRFDDVFDTKEFTQDKIFQTVENLGKQFNIAKQEIERYDRQLSQLDSKKQFFEDIAEGTKRNSAAFVNLQDELKNLDIAVQNELLGSDTPAKTFSQLTEQYQREREYLEKLVSDPQINTFYEKLLSYAVAINAEAKNNYRIQTMINRVYEPQTQYLSSQLKVLDSFPKKIKERLSLEKQIIDLTLAQDNEAASLLLGKERTNALLKNETEYHKDIVQLLQKQRDFRIDKIMAKAAENSRIFKEILTSAFSNIPNDIFDNAEKRKDLAKELREAEFELQEARADGDNKSIADAQYRVDLVKYEMSQYKKGLKEIGDIFESIFGGISKAYWDKLSENVAESLSRITIKGTSLGDVIGDSITRATSEFIGSWKSETNLIIADYISKLKSALNEHVIALQGIKGVQVAEQVNQTTQQISVPIDYEKFGRDKGMPNKETGSSQENMTTELRKVNSQLSSQTQLSQIGNTESNEQTKKLSDTEYAIRSVGSMIASSIATAIFGTQSKAANMGSGVGSMFGSAYGSTLGWAGGPIGSLLGGIAGGLIGGIFGGKEEPVKPLISAIDKNTEAVYENTITLQELDKAIFNAPTNFNVPSNPGRGFGGNVTIHINESSNAKQTALEVRKVLEDIYKDEDRASGTRGYSPI